MHRLNYNDHSLSLSLLDLPTELVLIVLGLIDDEDLYSLALLNRQLHHLALRMYLTNQDLDWNQNFEKSLYLSMSSVPILRGLRIALFVQALDTLDFWCV